MSDHWTQAVIHMKAALKKNNNYLDYMLEFSPDDDVGYVWTQDEEYKKISRFLDNETNSDGHSGASFACCLRASIDQLRDEMRDEMRDEIITAEICNDSLTYEEGTIISVISD